MKALVVVGLALLLAQFLYPSAASVSPTSAVCGNVPCAQAQMSVIDFSENSLSWSIKAIVDGNVRNSVVLSEAVGTTVYGNVYKYNGVYDAGTNTTTFLDSFQSPFTSRSGDAIWYFQYFFSVNASVQNLVHNPLSPSLDAQALQLPSLNYRGNNTIWPVYGSNPFSRVGFKVGLVYNVTSFIWRIPEASGALWVLTTLFPSILYAVLGILACFPAVQFSVFRYRHTVDEKSRDLARKVLGQHLLNDTYFGVLVGVLFFLPIYILSLAPLMAPILVTPQLLWNNLYTLMGLYAALLVVSLIIYLGIKLRQSTDNSAREEDINRRFAQLAE